MNKIILNLALVFALMVSVAEAQTIRRGGWDINPVFSAQNGSGLYTAIAGNLLIVTPIESAIEGSGEIWPVRLAPCFQTKFRLAQKIKTPDGDASVKWWDWGMRSFSAGYIVGYTSYTSPFGFAVEVDYEKQNWKAKLPGREDFENYCKQMVTPTGYLRFRIGSKEADFNVLLEPGVKYNYAFKARGDYNDKDYVNNGLTGIAGLGFYIKSMHLMWRIRYERDLFDFFNEDFVAPDGTTPYKGYTTTHSLLVCSMGISL